MSDSEVRHKGHHENFLGPNLCAVSSGISALRTTHFFAETVAPHPL